MCLCVCVFVGGWVCVGRWMGGWEGGWVLVGVNACLFSFLLSVVNSDNRVLTLKVCLGNGGGVFLLGGNVKFIENFRQISSDTGHFLLYYHITISIVPLHKLLHMYNSYEYDCDWLERLLTLVVDVSELEKYKVLVCF